MANMFQAAGKLQINPIFRKEMRIDRQKASGGGLKQTGNGKVQNAAFEKQLLQSNRYSKRKTSVGNCESCAAGNEAEQQATAAMQE